MEADQLYNGADPDLVAFRTKARVLLHEFNQSSPTDPENRTRILSELIGAPTDAWIEPPFFCDYGPYIKLGKRVYMNFNCCVLDVSRVTIGDGTLFGPNVQVLTATHPWEGNQRRTGLEFGKPIVIGRNCWLGGGAVICPGVTIGENSVVAAGAVVTKDVEPNSIVAGNPARLIRKVPPLRDEAANE
jgi:maltose O-acetyltransferase